MDTIFALSSGSAPAAIAVLRISGPAATDVARRLCGGSLPPPRQAALRALRDPADGDLLDRGLVLWFAAPATATGEDLVELHLHGGRAIIAAVTAVLAAQPGLRPALPGEFTRRALTNGRIDLAEAEGLGDLLMAETQTQRRRALAMAEGAVSRAVAAWTRELLTIAAMVEARLDFADEDDVAAAGDAADAVARRIDRLVDAIAAVLAAPPVERIRDGVRVTLAGPPNSGKSTLLNALAGREAAIVSPIAGTTRDRIEAVVARRGVAYVLTDTAGLAQRTDDPIEAIGIDRARDAIAAADIILWLGDDPPAAAPPVTLWLYPRADARPPCADTRRLAVAAAQGAGVERLWEAIDAATVQLLPREDQLGVNRRQREWLVAAVAELRLAAGQGDPLLVAEHLRLARHALDRITGAAHVEDMLDALFARFCIGK